MLTKLFHHEIHTNITCPCCLTGRRLGTTTVDNATYIVQLPILLHRNGSTHEIVSVQDAIEAYFTPEEADLDYRWDGCQHCGPLTTLPHFVRHVKTCPHVLAITLKRFDEYNRKLTHYVHPSPLVQFGGCDYKLHAVVVHRGGTQGGHYWAYSLQRIANSSVWFLYNDTALRTVTNEDWLRPQDSIGTGHYYCFFYQRADIAIQNDT